MLSAHRSPKDSSPRAVQARVGIIDKLHHDLDAAVSASYGWETDLSPSAIVANLVALNAERAAEEATGHIRYLRPEYQVRLKSTPNS